MLPQIWSRLGPVRQLVIQHTRRNFGVTAVAVQKTEPIQQLFVDKVREYAQKSKAAGGKLVDSTTQLETKLKDELDKIDRVYTASGDMTQFPAFNFVDPQLDIVGVDGSRDSIKQSVVQNVEEEVDSADRNKPFFDY